jgi:Chaperone of endosialidase
MKTRTPPVLITFALAFAFVQNTQAVNPPPDGGYPGGNTAEGQNALFGLTTGTFNSALGFLSLSAVAGGNFCTGVGAGALLLNTADGNTAVGAAALLSNTTGSGNIATGLSALGNNTNGTFNTAIGNSALLSNTTGFANVALGDHAGSSLTTGGNNICIGYAEVGVAGESNTIRIGTDLLATYIGGISGQTAPGGAAVFVASNGKLGTATSSRRFKKDIADMDSASDALLALRPVTFRYKPELDQTGIQQFGLVAEEVAKVNPDLVVRDEKGEIYTVRYDAVNAMLLNEFLKEHRTLRELKFTVAKQEAAILQQKKDFQAIASQQQKQIEALTAGLQKVSAQLEASKPAPQVVNNQSKPWLPQR